MRHPPSAADTLANPTRDVLLEPSPFLPYPTDVLKVVAIRGGSTPGFYPVDADTSERGHLGPGGVSWENDGSTARNSSVRRLA